MEQNLATLFMCIILHAKDVVIGVLKKIFSGARFLCFGYSWHESSTALPLKRKTLVYIL